MPMFEVRSVPGAGRGLFATRDISAGALCYEERAAVEVWSPPAPAFSLMLPKPPSLVTAACLAANRDPELRRRLLTELCPLGADFEALYLRFARAQLDQTEEERLYDALVFPRRGAAAAYLLDHTRHLPELARDYNNNSLNSNANADGDGDAAAAAAAEVSAPLNTLLSAAVATASAGTPDDAALPPDSVARTLALLAHLAPQCPELAPKEMVKIALACAYNAFQLALPTATPATSGAADVTVTAMTAASMTATASATASATATAMTAAAMTAAATGASASDGARTLPQPGGQGRGVFVSMSLVNHSCWPNCAWSPVVAAGAGSGAGAATRLQLRTTRAVRRGEQLTVAYSDIALPPQRRGQHLARSHRFYCACARCQAYTDATTNANARTVSSNSNTVSGDAGNSARAVHVAVESASGERVTTAAVAALLGEDVTAKAARDPGAYAESPARIYFDRAQSLLQQCPQSECAQSPQCPQPQSPSESQLLVAGAVEQKQCSARACADAAEAEATGKAADTLMQSVWCDGFTSLLRSISNNNNNNNNNSDSETQTSSASGAVQGATGGGSCSPLLGDGLGVSRETRALRDTALTVVALSELAPAVAGWAASAQARGAAVVAASHHKAGVSALSGGGPSTARGLSTAARSPGCHGVLSPRLGYPTIAVTTVTVKATAKATTAVTAKTAATAPPEPVFACNACGLTFPFLAVFPLLTQFDTAAIAPLRGRATALRRTPRPVFNASVFRSLSHRHSGHGGNSSVVAEAEAEAEAEGVTRQFLSSVVPPSLLLLRQAERALAAARALAPPQSWLVSAATDASLLVAAAVTDTWAKAEATAAAAAATAMTATSPATVAAADPAQSAVTAASAAVAAASELCRRRFVVSSAAAALALAQARAWRALMPRHHPKRVIGAMRAAAAVAAAGAGEGADVYVLPAVVAKERLVSGALLWDAPVSEGQWEQALGLRWRSPTAETHSHSHSGSPSNLHLESDSRVCTGVDGPAVLTDIVRLFIANRNGLISPANGINPAIDGAKCDQSTVFSAAAAAAAADYTAVSALFFPRQSRCDNTANNFECGWLPWSASAAPLTTSDKVLSGDTREYLHLRSAVAALRAALAAESTAATAAEAAAATPQHQQQLQQLKPDESERLWRLRRPLQCAAQRPASRAVTAAVCLLAEGALEHAVCYGSDCARGNEALFAGLARDSFKVPVATVIALVVAHYL